MGGAADGERPKRMVFVTVGTTCFDSLVKAVDSDHVKQELSKRGYTELLIQMGRGSYIPLQCSGEDGNLAVEFLTFSPSIADYLRSASLIISHAGSQVAVPSQQAAGSQQAAPSQQAAAPSQAVGSEQAAPSQQAAGSQAVGSQQAAPSQQAAGSQAAGSEQAAPSQQAAGSQVVGSQAAGSQPSGRGRGRGKVVGSVTLRPKLPITKGSVQKEKEH